MSSKNFFRFISIIAAVVLCIGAAQAQSTEFTYQGRLLFGDVPANGSYDFEFDLFDAATGGNQLGSNFPLSAVAVNNGVFSVRIDFGDQFPGANRFLEIHVKQNGSVGYAVLSPRQAISSAPYSIKSLNAANADTATNASQLGGVMASQFIVTSDTRLSDARVPLPNSANYLQNSTSLQAATNFNIGGNGTVGGTLSARTVNVTSEYDISGNRILANPGLANTFVGIITGLSNTGDSNSFFGQQSGQRNTSGSVNSFFGLDSGTFNTTGSRNSFFGGAAGDGNTTGTSNSSFGTFAGANISTGSNNSFFGADSGGSNTAESNNTFIGSLSNGTAGITNATAVGFNASVAQSNSLVLGSILGVNRATADTRVGIGTTAPAKHLHIFGSGDQEIAIESSDSGGRRWTVQSSRGSADGNFQIIDRTLNASRLTILSDGSVGIGSAIAGNRLNVSGMISVSTLGGAGSTSLCRNASNQISTCSSSIRYKKNINAFTSGLDLVRQLRPVSFNWKADGTADFGLVAEEVNKVEPLLTTTNEKGEVEGVKYDRVGVVLVNAVNEQQSQIEDQQKQINVQKEVIVRQQAEIDALKKLVCSRNRSAAICRSNR